MSENWEGWTVSEKRPGYRVKVLKFGIHTVELYRPIFNTPEEQAVAERRVMDDLARAKRAELAARQEGMTA